MKLRTVITAIVLGLVFVASAHAQDARDRDWNAWFKSLKQPTTGMSCCDISDCKVTYSWWAKNHWKALLPSGKEIDVPNVAVKNDKAGQGPGGEAVMCASPEIPAYPVQVYCFVPKALGF